MNEMEPQFYKIYYNYIIIYVIVLCEDQSKSTITDSYKTLKRAIPINGLIFECL